MKLRLLPIKRLKSELERLQTPNLNQWLERIEACHPSEIELGLDRLKLVAERLDLSLDRAFKVVAGGTNGKGSSLAMLDAILLQSGLTTGRYSSPHFLHYNERVLLNGQPASDEAFCRAFEIIESARTDIPLTYFEYGTLAALLIMSDADVDVMLLEVGLGGRLDAVNIVDADLAMVSTVALDHIDWLGTDREVIGFEKAGIFRSHKPALCGDPEPPQSLLTHAEAIGALLYARNQAFAFAEGEADWSWRGQGADGVVELKGLPNPGLPLANAAMILQAVHLLPFSITEQQIHNGLQQAELTGRMQSCQWRGLNLVLDVAHNPEAAIYLAAQLQHAQGPVQLVLGMLHDKDITSVVDALESAIDHWYPVNLDVPRGSSAKQLCDELAKVGVSEDRVHPKIDVAEALAELADAGAEGTVVVAGSFFTVAGALACISKDK